MLGKLVVIPEVVASKVNDMKENKSTGVDGISPKSLKETVEQNSTPLALCSTCHCRMELYLYMEIS